MDMNRLLGNVDGALDRALRSRKLEFQLMCAAAESRRAAKEIQDETSTEEEETEYEDGAWQRRRKKDHNNLKQTKRESATRIWRNKLV